MNMQIVLHVYDSLSRDILFGRKTRSAYWSLLVAGACCGSVVQHV